MSEKKCLVTTSLISSVEWAKTAPTSIIKKEKGGDGKTTWREKGVKDLVATLNRDSYEMNETAQRGINFENKVYAVARSGVISEGSDHFRKVVAEIIGGQLQRKNGIDYECGGEHCYLYVREDVFFEDKEIIDIKTTAKYKRDSYIESLQHTIYCFVEKVWKFRYIVAEWEDYPKIKEVHIIPLQIDPDFAKRIIDAKINEVFNYLKGHGLWEIYREKFCLY